jgi:hypothetical protein
MGHVKQAEASGEQVVQLLGQFKQYDSVFAGGLTRPEGQGRQFPLLRWVLTGHVRQAVAVEQVVQLLGQVKQDDSAFAAGLTRPEGHERQFPLLR